MKASFETAERIEFVSSSAVFFDSSVQMHLRAINISLDSYILPNHVITNWITVANYNERFFEYERLLIMWSSSKFSFL